MSDRDPDEPVFKNPATLQRRAWIDRALASVRDSLRDPDRAAGDPHDPAHGTGALPEQASPPRPQLVVVRGSRRDA